MKNFEITDRIQMRHQVHPGDDGYNPPQPYCIVETSIDGEVTFRCSQSNRTDAYLWSLKRLVKDGVLNPNQAWDALGHLAFYVGN